MSPTIPKPDSEFLATAQLVKALIEREESATRARDKMRFQAALKKKFCEAFDLSPDRGRLGPRLYNLLARTEYGPRGLLIDHVDYFQHHGNVVMVSQPYHIDEAELIRWAGKCDASYTIATDWGYHFPGHAALFFVEFSPEAKAALEKRLRSH